MFIWFDEYQRCRDRGYSLADSMRLRYGNDVPYIYDPSYGAHPALLHAGHVRAALLSAACAEWLGSRVHMRLPPNMTQEQIATFYCLATGEFSCMGYARRDLSLEKLTDCYILKVPVFSTRELEKFRRLAV